MDEKRNAALDTALAYHRAWTGGEFELAMSHISPDMVCQAPAGRLEGAVAFRGFMEPFTRIVTGSELIAAFGDDRAAVLIYDTATVTVPNAPGAEHLLVTGGKITHVRIIFDRLPFDRSRPPRGATA